MIFDNIHFNKLTKTLLTLSSIVVFFSFSGCQKKSEPLPVSQDQISVPYQEFTNSTLYFYNNNYIQWKLVSSLMKKPISDTGSIFVTPVKLTLFDSLGVVRSYVLADSGIIKNSMDSYTIWGNVYIRTRDTMVVQTQRLIWYKNRRRVESNTFVQIETKKGDRLRGKGLDATEDFSYFKFLSDVKGSFPNFKNRVEKNEDDVF